MRLTLSGETRIKILDNISRNSRHRIHNYIFSQFLINLIVDSNFNMIIKSASESRIGYIIDVV